ncbi:MAG TPA: Gfo/Idh/MocA family oxidoreductase [Mesorhizobium sp.]|jgi:predicted dehydrogenase|uniref:Gfo/Idh/MocA family protein n=1 Tax=Mesorhizobium sp. TaxID=1871066 RepID=UPI002DDCD1BA|nr:Gfo/Idh/MocA family oxidoreductase [Mesorhizobium sp.]HEV2507036.1 Gfo/Idh/MocA family oxidoreductase [Mesorhizobium sp.]
MSKRIGLGIVGLGAMGTELLEAAARHDDFEVMLCADVNEAAVTRERRRYPGIGFTTEPRTVVASEGVDAVYIATPPRFHAAYAMEAMRAGKAVFCEKPLAVDLAEGQAMADLAAQTGVVAAVNFALSDRHATLEIERALAAGELGNVGGADIRLAFPQWPRAFQADAGWLSGRAEGGFVREVFSHFAYLTDRLIGELEPVFATLDFPQGDEASEISAFGLFRAGGIPVRVFGQAGLAVPESYEWVISGSHRSYRLRNWGELQVSDGKAWQDVTLLSERGSEYTRLSAFARAIRGEPQTNLADFAAGLRVQRAVEAFHAKAN